MQVNDSRPTTKLSLSIIEIFLQKNYKYYVFEHVEEEKKPTFLVSFFKDVEDAIQAFDMLFFRAKDCKIGCIAEPDLLEVASGSVQARIYLKSNVLN
jgi:hypothetical protein